MAMPPNQSPRNSLWWDRWFFTHGKDSELEAAFVGRLTTRGLHAFALTEAELDAAWAEFQAFLAASDARI